MRPTWFAVTHVAIASISSSLATPTQPAVDAKTLFKRPAEVAVRAVHARRRPCIRHAELEHPERDLLVARGTLPDAAAPEVHTERPRRRSCFAEDEHAGGRVDDD